MYLKHIFWNFELNVLHLTDCPPLSWAVWLTFFYVKSWKKICKLYFRSVNKCSTASSSFHANPVQASVLSVSQNWICRALFKLEVKCWALMFALTVLHWSRQAFHVCQLQGQVSFWFSWLREGQLSQAALVVSSALWSMAFQFGVIIPGHTGRLVTLW